MIDQRLNVLLCYAAVFSDVLKDRTENEVIPRISSTVTNLCNTLKAVIFSGSSSGPTSPELLIVLEKSYSEFFQALQEFEMVFVSRIDYLNHQTRREKYYLMILKRMAAIGSPPTDEAP